jgi:4-amino-4-deoxy-L-arabinose transferase-like glycosyltransferase
MMAAVQVPTAERGFARRLAAIAAGGLAVRLIYTLALTPDLRGLGDATYYHQLARVLADGRGFLEPTFGTPTALHPPLFPLVLALPAWLGIDSYEAQRVIVCLIGTATIVTAGLLARHVAGARVGLIAAGLAALSPVLVSADSAVMSETLLGLLVALCALAAYRLRERPNAARAALLGVLIALAALTRGEALLLVPLLLPWRSLKLAGVLVAACGVVLAPWTIRNFSAFEEPVLLSTNEGGLIAGANCPSTYRGHDIGSWDLRCVPQGRGEDESQQAVRGRRAGLDYAGDHAGRVPLVVLARLGRTFEAFQPVRQAEHAEGRALGLEVAGAVWWWLMLPPSVYGVVLLRRRGVPLMPLIAPFALAVAATVVGYGVPRFRHPADVAAVVLAAVALDGLIGSSLASPRSTGTGGETSRFKRSTGRSTT